MIMNKRTCKEEILIFMPIHEPKDDSEESKQP